MSFASITNRGEYFSNHYLDAVIGNDLNDVRRRWEEREGRSESSGRSRLRGLGSRFFAARADAAEATRANRADALRRLNDLVLDALGYPCRRTTVTLTAATIEELRVPVAASVDTGSGPLLVAIEAGLADDVDDLFDAPFADRHDGALSTAGLLLEPLHRFPGDKVTWSAVDAVAEIFGTDEPPRFVLLLGGRIVLLADRTKWAEGRFLAVDLDSALERNDTRKGGELELIAALVSADVIVPGALSGSSTDDGDDDEGGATSASGGSILDDLLDKSFKHAVGVSKDLRNGIRRSIEILANEVIEQRLAANLAVYTGANRVDPKALTRQCLRYLYRLVVLLYAESRPELGVLPINDDAYMAGYSLDRLRELCLVDLDTERARNGSHLEDSLQRLFDLVNDGYHAEHAQHSFVFAAPDDATPTREEYLQFPGLDAALFDPASTPLLNSVTLRNEALQQVLTLLMLTSDGKRRGRGTGGDRAFISYATLGINQLGAVYEGLMAYSGFFADGDLYEVAKHGDPSDGTWMLPVEDADSYPDEVFVLHEDPATGRLERVRHPRGSFVFRLSGRDRQRSASYYTPEVLTRCVVKHALAELLGLDDYAPEGGSAGIVARPGGNDSLRMLDLTICEPALGSGAFLNEAINQLSAAYLQLRQVEVGETLDAESYLRELQKVKAHFALHQSYGVDLNATAVELAEVSLWLNAMYPGLKAPWFGLQLRRGNSLIGCRRAIWTADQFADKPWTKTKKGDVVPPTDVSLAEPIPDGAVHHFLLPGHGWGAVADRKEAKELAPDAASALKQWKTAILKAPSKRDLDRLGALARGAEELWAYASARVRETQRALRRDLELWRDDTSRPARTSITRAEAERNLGDTNSALGRLRMLMDAWTGLWFWPLEGVDTLPTWSEWLDVAERLVPPVAPNADDRLPAGQLDLFVDLEALLAADEATHRVPVDEILTDHPWLARAVELAQREGAWHWELEFAPVFADGGFDLQVGNPPWVRPRWADDLILAEFDPWWGITENAPDKLLSERRYGVLAANANRTSYLGEVASAEGVVHTLGSPQLRPVLSGVQTNLYMVFMDTVWRHAHNQGIGGLLHPEGHFVDPNAGDLRRATYRHLRRHWQFVNELRLFGDVHNNTEFGVHVYGLRRSVGLKNISELRAPETVDRSLAHDGSGNAPGIQFPTGGWDLRPHAARVLTIDEEVLADWARLFDEKGTPAEQARLLRPVTRVDLESLSVLADQPVRLADHDYHWSSGWHEKGAKADRTIRWATTVLTSWNEVILQGPHFTVATPFAKQPNDGCRNNRDYVDWDLENLPERVIPRTNYQRACDRDTYESRLDHWKGRPSTAYWRHVHREMTQPGLERSVQGAILPPGPAHINACLTYAFPQLSELLRWAGMLASLPVDYLFKASGAGHIAEHQLSRLPFPDGHQLDVALALRTLRLNCLTADYAPLWDELWDRDWKGDVWTVDRVSEPELAAMLARVPLGAVDKQWSTATPLRRDAERRQALVELDAISAIMLGLSAEQLCAMFRTQFAVLRKYEYRMAFDAEGRKICAYHQSAGYRQSQIQARSKAGDLSKEWSNVWKRLEEWENTAPLAGEPDARDVDAFWQGHYTPPFTRPDREREMTRAYNEFQRRLDAGEYGDAAVARS